VCVPAAPDLTGRALDDRYELHAVIGEGAFGRVYRGLDRRLARIVAVKVIKPWWAEDTAWVERFEREAQLLARVSDPGIVQIYDIGHAKEGPYYVAELVDGESLAERLLRGPLPAGEAREVAEQLCDALASAHAQGVVHCDVKPANVLLARDGSLKVGDFGVARLAGGTSQALSATVAGTPRYMSPEQARGRPTSAATDVYSAGVVLYEMLTGEPPFMDGSAVELGLRHLQDAPAPLPRGVPGDLADVVDRALAKDPSERWHDGAEMASALRACGQEPLRGAVHRERPDPEGHEERGGTATIVLEQPATVRLSSADRLDTASAAAETRILGGRRPPASGPSPAPSRARRRRRLIVPAALVLGLAGALVAFLLADAGSNTTVPDLHGLPRGGVEARAQRLDVHPSFASRFSSSTPGTAISQDPSAGSHVPAGSTVAVVLSAGPPPVTVPAVVGQSAETARIAIRGAGLHSQTALVAAPGTSPGIVVGQTPAGSQTSPRGSTVALRVAEEPRWRPLTSFSGVDEGRSVVFRILGRSWRVSYGMAYQGTCELLVVCQGPSAAVRNMESGATFGSFELGEGAEQTHTFAGGPGLYRIDVSAGNDSARWNMTVEDRY